MNKIGEGQNLIFFHGGGASYNSYFPLIKEISKYFTIYYFNLPGHGREATDGDPHSAIKQIYNQIKTEKIDNPILLGHSFGGFCAYEIARQLENVSKVILIDPLLIEYKENLVILIFRFLIKKNIRGLIINKKIAPFFISVLVDLVKNIFYQNMNVFKSIKLLINSAYCKKSEYTKNFNLKILHGKEDSIIPYKDIEDKYKEFITLIDGEHDWCMNNVEKTVQEIRKYLFALPR